MKHALIITLALFSTSAFAWPGSEMLRCNSVAGSEATIALEIWKAESNADDMPAGIKLTINGKSFNADEENSAVQHIHFVRASEDKVFTATYDQTIKGWVGSLRLWALASTYENISDADDSSVERYRFKARMKGSIWNLREEGAYADITEMECTHNYYHGS